MSDKTATEIRFYHLLHMPLERALPEILSKAYDRDYRAVIMTDTVERVEALNSLLWTANPNSFLPHGSEQDGHANNQPIWLTTKDENPNQANLLVLTNGAASQKMDTYALCCEIFDGTDDHAVTEARTRWKTYKEDGFDISYFQQTPNGGWEKKA